MPEAGTYSYADSDRSGSGARSIKWNAISLIGRQGLIIVFSVLLARLLGPESIGLVAQATVIVSFCALLLDQGLTASLISAEQITKAVVGAASTVNLLLGLVLTAVVLVASRQIAGWLNMNSLSEILPLLSFCILLKAICVVPRMLLMRQLNFKPIAMADLISAFLAGLLAITLAFAGVGVWAVVWQLVAMDAIATLWMLVAARPPLPNFKFNSMRNYWKFGVQVFFGNLVAFSSRNLDNLLVGKIYGANVLGVYSLAYRVLLTPVQMLGQVVSRVLFPSIARSRAKVEARRLIVLRSVRGLACVSFPVMAALAISSYEWVELLLGSAWISAAPVIAVLALTGARQAVTSINAPILLGMGRSDVHLRFNLIAGAVQVAGIVVGLAWGALGVAVGYTVAGILLTPLILYLQKRYADIPYRLYVVPVVSAIHGCAWVLLSYFAVRSLNLGSAWTLVIGVPLSLACYMLSIRLAHRGVWSALVSDVKAISSVSPLGESVDGPKPVAKRTRQ